MTIQEIINTGGVTVVRIKQGDVLLFRVPRGFPAQQIAQLVGSMDSCLPGVSVHAIFDDVQMVLLSSFDDSGENE